MFLVAGDAVATDAVPAVDPVTGATGPNRLRTRGSWVQILPGAPVTETPRCAGAFLFVSRLARTSGFGHKRS